MHELDEVDWARRTFVPKLDRLLQPLDMYAENVAHPDEYALTYRGGVEAAERVLSRGGVLRNGAAGYKTAEPYGVREAGSWAWRYDPDEPDTYRWFGDRQVHITMFEVEKPSEGHVLVGPKVETHIFAHDELNPWRHPVRHYRGEDVNVSSGVHWAHHFFASRDVSYKIYADLDDAFEE